MTPEKALELVGRYARLQKEIKLCKSRIGDNLEKCNGLRGHRKERDSDGTPSEAACLDQETHLKDWYTYITSDYEYGESGGYLDIGIDELKECPHCYAAHKVVLERKIMKRKLAAVKAAMTRGGA